MDTFDLSIIFVALNVMLFVILRALRDLRRFNRMQAARIRTRIVTREEAIKWLLKTQGKPNKERVSDWAKQMNYDWKDDGARCIYVHNGMVTNLRDRDLLAGMILANKELKFTIIETKT